MSTLRHRRQARTAHRGGTGAAAVSVLDVAIGHNGGPPIEEPVNDGFVRWRWRKAHREVWRNPPLSILRFRVARAEAAGVSYHAYMLELLDTGRHLQAGDIARNRKANPRR